MEKITGIGGFFFRSRNPRELSLWYEAHFGIKAVPHGYDEEPWQQQSGSTVFGPFPSDSIFFERAEQSWAINFRVNDLGKMVEQLRSAGIDVAIDPETYPNGRFARLHDPEGNPIDLWEPQPATR